ncbi:MAG TPA: hypothetical protein VIA45_06890 [Thermoanaerobaculia bacterium]|jgi:hypothetical protein
MTRWKLAATLLLFAAPTLLGDSGAVSVTATGWFDCDRCTAGRVKNGDVGPAGQECARKCIKEGAKVVFLDEKRKASFVVDNPEKTRGIESDYVEFTGTMNAEAGTVHVDSVKVKSKYVASCGKPKSKTAKTD